MSLRVDVDRRNVEIDHAHDFMVVNGEVHISVECEFDGHTSYPMMMLPASTWRAVARLVNGWVEETDPANAPTRKEGPDA